MLKKNIAPEIKSNIDINADEFLYNKDVMLKKISFLDELLDKAELGGGTYHHERLAKRGKMPVRERIFNLLDPDTPFLEISPFAAFGTDYTVGGGCVAGIGIVAGTECVIFANDPSVLAGAMTVYVGKKWDRAMEIARDNHLPYINFVESAGGAYQPGMSDYNIFIKDQAKVFLAGPPLVKMATGEESDDETLGGAKMHSEISGLSDYLAEDEMDALRLCRNVVSHLHWQKEGHSPIKQTDEPVLAQEDLLGLVDEDLKSSLDIREVIGRIVDGSRFEEFKSLYGKTMICGWSMLHGYPIGILGNNGPIYPESSEKAASFIQLCNKRNIPLIFLQNVTGFLVGKDFERQAIIKKGSQLINAVSNSNVPHLTVIIGASFGAGTYAMSGRAYNNRFTFLWPTAKIAVMGSKQIAGVMSIVRRARATRKGEKFDEKLDAQIVQSVEQAAEQMSEGLVASSMLTDDGIIDPRDTRDVLGFCLSIVCNSPIEGATEYGVFRL